MFKLANQSDLSSPKGQRTREHILGIALKLFQEKGFENTTMREIAQEASLAVGATYYYFRTKEEIVFAFYEKSLEELVDESQTISTQSKDLQIRIRSIMTGKFQQLLPYRNFLIALAKSVVDPNSPLSPFGSKTEEIREKAIQIFENAVKGSSNRIPENLVPILPRLLWLYHMGLIFYWINDRSENQTRSHQLLDQSLKFFMQLIRLARFPLMGKFVQPVIQLVIDFANPIPPLVKG